MRARRGGEFFVALEDVRCGAPASNGSCCWALAIQTIAAAFDPSRATLADGVACPEDMAMTTRSQNVATRRITFKNTLRIGWMMASAGTHHDRSAYRR